MRGKALALLGSLLLVGSQFVVCCGALQAAPQSTTPLESLTFVTSTGVVVNSPSHSGVFHGRPISRGLEIGPAPYSSVTLALGNRYETLTGVVYVNDAQQGVGTFSISGVDLHGNKTPLFSTSLGQRKQAFFKISTHGSASLVLTNAGAGFFDVVADLSSINGLPPISSEPQVVVRYPSGGAGVAAESKVPFAWEPFPNAVNYILQIWLVKRTDTAPITADSRVAQSTLIYQKTSYVWDNHGFPPGIYQFDLIPLDVSGNALAPPGTPQQLTVAS